MRKGTILPIAPSTSSGQAPFVTYPEFFKTSHRQGSVLPIAVMAFAIVAFLFMVTWAVTPNQTWPWTTKTTQNTNSILRACTLEAKLCPDGSAVGRTGLNCAFAECPTSNTNSSASLKTFSNSDNGLTFQYPASRIVREYTNNFEVRVMDASDPERDQSRATGAVAGPGDIGIARLSKFYSDPKQYLISTFTLRAEITTTTVAGETAYRVTYAQPFGVSEDDLIIYAFNHNGSTWYARLDLTGIAGSADEDFEAIVKSIAFTDSTTGWKTYTNTTYGYSVKYPATYTLSGSDEAKKIDITDYPNGIVQHFAIYEATGSNDATFSEPGIDSSVIGWIKNARAGFPNTDLLFNRRATTIGGKKFVTYDYDLGGSGGSVQYYLVQGNKVLIIHDWPGGAGNKEFNPLQDGRILPTFAFTK